MTYDVIILYTLHIPSIFLRAFTEYSGFNTYGLLNAYQYYEVWKSALKRKSFEDRLRTLFLRVITIPEPAIRSFCYWQKIDP